MSIEIEYDKDKDKDKVNKNKHKGGDGERLSLAFGQEILCDPHRVEVVDTRYDYGEDRIICFSKVKGRVYVCIYTMREDRHRIISVRKGNDDDVRRYETPTTGLG